ncbi:1-acylglycerol-3-phosphate O-acyltransferase [Paraglaciecola hydrolytica]|uniref:1-acyl-sn-glycerol-3-phosphate acyltransferase n=1 Tax=Paraglaciecola hydrolytica TaxID=1799789 RepID=A0A148KMK3_9ALTE|nr:1-acylglycerol-3-phosphate O-acyltransferase [Paraglaciecola hydrolytica]KXI27475.1 acyl-phosphate glycerol 3-phosphate acyltransferase [Paraglaciecola hydrolytica]
MLALIRVIFILFYFLLINFILIVVCLARPFHRDNVHFAGKLYSSVVFFLGLKIELRIPPSVVQGGPFVFIANHQNSYDLLTICAAAQKGTVTVGKKSLKWIPIFGWVYWLSGNIMIDRKDSGKAQDTLQGAVKKIQNRKLSVWFFPEGTRSYGRGLLPFKSGAFRLAKACNEPIVTIAASNLHNKIKLNRWDNGTLLIEASEPQLMDSSKGTKAWVNYFHQQMSEQITKLDAEIAQRNA